MQFSQVGFAAILATFARFRYRSALPPTGFREVHSHSFSCAHLEIRKQTLGCHLVIIPCFSLLPFAGIGYLASARSRLAVTSWPGALRLAGGLRASSRLSLNLSNTLASWFSLKLVDARSQRRVFRSQLCKFITKALHLSS